MDHLQPPFRLFSYFKTVANKQILYLKLCLWVDSNRGPLMSEATATPTDPQPLLSFMLVGHSLTESDTFCIFCQNLNRVSLGNSCDLFTSSKVRLPRPLFNLFSVFFKQTSIQFYKKLFEKYTSREQCWNSNRQPSDCESHPITTGLGLPP